MKEIVIKISSLTDESFGTLHYTHYCLFPKSHPTWRYSVTASLEGFAAMCSMWEEAGYTITFENQYPK